MTEVLTVPRGRSPSFQTTLRRTASHPVLLGSSTSHYLGDSSIKSPFLTADCTSQASASTHSSPSSSPQFSATSVTDHLSLPSTPASTPASTPGGLYTLDQKQELENQISHQRPFSIGSLGFDSDEDDDEVCHVENAVKRENGVVLDASSSTETLIAQMSTAELSEMPRSAGDDSAIEVEPTRHVDYLSHNWAEEEIWSSWRYVVSRRKEYNNSLRLENASWRTWMKSKYGLKTVSPDELNWLKESDVTWLYGPLQTDQKQQFRSPPKMTPPPSQLSQSGSFLKKPILKKKSASEAILQRSLSAHALLKHAGAILQAQEADRLRIERPQIMERAQSDFGVIRPPLTFHGSEDYSTDASTALSSMSSSGLQSPGERRHISFNNEVVQCIAVENKGAEDDEDDVYDNSDPEDEEVVMMKRVSSRTRINNINTPRGSFCNNDSVTIKPLPPTTLKYREDTPEPLKPNPLGSPWGSSAKLTPSLSQETLRPSKSTANFLLPDEDENDEVLDWQPKWNDVEYTNPSNGSSKLGQSSKSDEEDSGRGLRLTNSGMFMPYEDEDEAAMEAGLFGKVVDTVNTARDIAHVIWNVGWRR